MMRSLWVCLVLLPALTPPSAPALKPPGAQALVQRGASAVNAGDRKPAITWKKIVIDKTFRSEGVAVADVNKDGKLDVLVGDVWYEAPDWKMHIIRADGQVVRPGWKVQLQGYNPERYSESFACWADDINKDGWPDLIVIGWPGDLCHWYENPQNKPGPWKQRLIWHSACNETPAYVDLFGKGQKVLLMGWQPKGSKGNMGQMAFFTPGADPTQPWTMHPISGPSAPGKEVPGTQRFSHGLGVGDVNGDGRLDVICTGGWWEQPAKYDGQPWKFHQANLGEACADMHVHDMDGDGKNDVISSSAHQCGFWWHQQQASGTFIRRDLFPTPMSLAVLPKEAKLSPEEEQLFKAVNNHRIKEQKFSPLPYHAGLARIARAYLESTDKIPWTDFLAREKYVGRTSLHVLHGATVEEQLKQFVAQLQESIPYATEMAVGRWASGGKKGAFVVLGNSGSFLLMGQTHALHFVDLDGDGLKDLVTGRRWWAHGPKGDYAPSDPAFLYWFKAKRHQNGSTSFEPHQIDDDSGIGTQFYVGDLNGDGTPDIVISNKRGVFVFLQMRASTTAPEKE